MHTNVPALFAAFLLAITVITAIPANNSTPTPLEDATVVGEAILATPTSAAPPTPASSTAVSADCADTAFALETWRLSGTYTWSYNPAGAPATVSSTATTTIYRATANLIGGYNRCGTKKSLPLSHSYQGSTTRIAQISATATCTGNDGVSVTSWGALPGYTLGYTCAYYKTSTGVVLSSDLLLNSTRKWFTGPVPAGCTDSFDLESVVAHERGHTVGLAHVNQALHERQTMSPRTLPCTTYKRLPGSGDLKGLQTLTATL